MFYGNQIQDTRGLFFSSWLKYKTNQPLLALEKQLVDVIILHPEYHLFFETASIHDEPADFLGAHAVNPYFHLGLHLALRDQLATNRPVGIIGIYSRLMKKYANVSIVEHLMMKPLADALIKAQTTQTMPDEHAYLTACRQLT